MQFFTRLIFAILFTLQALPGVSAVQCAAMGAGTPALHTTVSDDSAACPCCIRDTDVSVECPSASDRVLACNCGQPQRTEPASPVGDPRNDQIQQLLVVTQTLVEIISPEPTPQMVTWSFVDPSPHRPANSIQSLLCVWVM